MNYIQVIDDRDMVMGTPPILTIRDDKAADNIVRCLVENGMMVKRQHKPITGLGVD